MLTENDIKEEISHIYAHAVATKLGYKYERAGNPDRDSIDGTIRAKGSLTERTVNTSPVLDIQLKATATQPNPQALSFVLPLKNYNDLRANRSVPAILVVLFLPANANDWITHNPTELITRRCAYWVSLRGLQETENETAITIAIPTGNVFSPTNLKTMMEQISITNSVQ